MYKKKKIDMRNPPPPKEVMWLGKFVPNMQNPLPPISIFHPY